MLEQPGGGTERAPLSVHVEVIRTGAMLVAFSEEWATLLSRAVRATCFQHPDWLIPWWRCCGGDAQPYLLLLRTSNDELIGVVPLQRTHAPPGPFHGRGCWPVRMRVLRWLGQGNGTLTDTLGPTFAAGYERVGMQAALQYLDAHKHEWDVLALAQTSDELFQDITRWTQTSAKLRTFVRSSMGWLSIRLPADWETYQHTLSKNLRSNLARYRNRLQRQGHQVSYDVLTEAAAIREALPRLFRLHRLRAQAEGMKRHADYFATAASRATLIELAEVLSERRRLALAQLRIDGQVVALQLLLFQGEVMSLYFSGFDPQWSRYSVMMLTTRGSIEYAIAQGIAIVDLTAGAGSQAKRQWSNEEVNTQYVVVAGHTCAGSVCLWSLRLRQRLRTMMARVKSILLHMRHSVYDIKRS